MARKTAAAPGFVYPPYGRLHLRDQWECTKAPRVPMRWSDVLPAADYFKWVQSIRDQIQDELWPVWNEKSLSWHGSAERWMDALSNHDRKMMWGFSQYLDAPVSLEAGARNHLEMFLIEDGQAGLPGHEIESYFSGLSPQQTNYDAAGMFQTGLHWVCGSTAIILKKDLQRPRAHQIGLANGGDPAGRLYAQTADTPSMISGHCFEGCLAATWTARRHRMWAKKLDWAKAKPALQQWAVDIGDRRVMAQVHYPSDNIGSWWAAIDLLDRIHAKGGCGAGWMLSFLVEAIPLSRVYQALQADPPPVPLWKRLERRISSFRASRKGRAVDPRD